MGQQNHADACDVLEYCHTREWGRTARLIEGMVCHNGRLSWFVSGVIRNRGAKDETWLTLPATIDAVAAFERK